MYVGFEQKKAFNKSQPFRETERPMRQENDQRLPKKNLLLLREKVPSRRMNQKSCLQRKKLSSRTKREVIDMVQAKLRTRESCHYESGGAGNRHKKKLYLHKKTRTAGIKKKTEMPGVKTIILPGGTATGKGSRKMEQKESRDLKKELY